MSAVHELGEMGELETRPSPSLLLTRRIRVLDKDANEQPPNGNAITTTRFTWWNFIFLFLYVRIVVRVVNVFTS